MVPRPNRLAPKVLGVLAGRDMPKHLLEKWVNSADLVWAADAGLDRVLETGREPDLAVGDFDSASGLKRIDEDNLIRDRSQETTDCDKLLAIAAAQGIQAITLASIEGDLLDHTMATLHSAARADLQVRLALRIGIGWIVRPSAPAAVRTTVGRRISLLPLSDIRSATLLGVQWPFEARGLHAEGFTSISNRAADPVIQATVESGAAFLFVEFLDSEMPTWG